MKPQNNNIICVVTITSKSMNAYGTIYNCQVFEVLEGTLDSATIDMTILESSFDTYSFLDNQETSPFKVTFVKHQENEPYPIMPIDGFVDGNRTSWIIDDIKQYKK